MTLEENECAIIHPPTLHEFTDHSQLHLDFTIYFVSFCQPMLLTPVLNGIVSCYMNTYLDDKSRHDRKQAAISRVNSNTVAEL
jgi:hypothetical protein